jgi:hypothetical protein
MDADGLGAPTFKYYYFLEARREYGDLWRVRDDSSRPWALIEVFIFLCNLDR